MKRFFSKQVLFLTITFALLAFSAVTLFNVYFRKSSSFSQEDEVKKSSECSAQLKLSPLDNLRPIPCGYYSSSKDGEYEFYIGKIERVFKDGRKFLLEADIGGEETKQYFLGWQESNSLVVQENYGGLVFPDSENSKTVLVALDEEGLKTLASYAGNYALFSFFSEDQQKIHNLDVYQ